MSNTTHFIKINPAAEADVAKMNEFLRADGDYIAGVEFTYSEVVGDGSVQFFYNHPEAFTPEQESNAKILVKKVYASFIGSPQNLEFKAR